MVDVVQELLLVFVCSLSMYSRWKLTSTLVLWFLSLALLIVYCHFHPIRTLCRTKLLPVTRFGEHMDVNC